MSEDLQQKLEETQKQFEEVVEEEKRLARIKEQLIGRASTLEEFLNDSKDAEEPQEDDSSE